MRTILFATAIVLAGASAHADEVGVVVAGEATMQPQLAAHLEGWLRDHGRRLAASPLDPDSINTLIDCFVLGDESCARNVVEHASRSKVVVYVRVEASPRDEEGSRDLTLMGYWLAKGSLHAIADRRVCERCSEKQLRATADELAASLVHLAGPEPVEEGPRTSDPGPRPSVPAEDRGPMTEAPKSRMPLVLIGGGGATALAGITLIALGERKPATTGPQPASYRDYGPPGYALAAIGLAAVGAGAYLYFHDGARSAPVAAVGSTGGYVGWSGRF